MQVGKRARASADASEPQQPAAGLACAIHGLPGRTLRPAAAAAYLGLTLANRVRDKTASRDKKAVRDKTASRGLDPIDLASEQTDRIDLGGTKTESRGHEAAARRRFPSAVGPRAPRNAGQAPRGRLGPGAAHGARCVKPKTNTSHLL